MAYDTFSKIAQEDLPATWDFTPSQTEIYGCMAAAGFNLPRAFALRNKNEPEISSKTFRNHASAMYEKAEASSIVELSFKTVTHVASCIGNAVLTDVLREDAPPEEGVGWLDAHPELVSEHDWL